MTRMPVVVAEEEEEEMEEGTLVEAAEEERVAEEEEAGEAGELDGKTLPQPRLLPASPGEAS